MKNLRRTTKTMMWSLCALLFAVSMTLSSCKDKNDDPVIGVTSITLSETALTMVVGADETLKAEIEPEEASQVKVTWESSNENVATVSGGKVTAVSVGKTIITATAGDEEATCVVTVIAPETSVDLNTYSGEEQW